MENLSRPVHVIPNETVIASSRIAFCSGRISQCLLAIALLAARMSAQRGGAPAGEPAVLEPAKTIERELGDGQIHEYRLVLENGQYARVLVGQRTINVAIACIAPDGRALFTADSFAIGDEESAELIASASGAYRIRVTPSEPRAPLGRYDITLREAEPATQRHRSRIAAARAFSLAIERSRQGTREGMLEAIGRLDEAEAQWGAAQDSAGQAMSLYTAGLLSIELGDRQKAAGYTTRALPLAEASHDPKTEGRALNAIAEFYNQFGDKRKAIENYERALPLLRTSGDRAGEGSVSSNLAVAYSGIGNRRKALDLFTRAAWIFRELQDRRMLAEVSGNAGVTYDNLGESQRALENHQQDLALERELGNRASEAIALNNIATAYSGLGEYQKALDAYTAALDLNRSMDNRRNVAINLNNIAWVYSELGDQRRALNFYQNSLDMIREVKDQRRIAITLNNIAQIHAELGEYRKAIEIHNEALPLRRAVGDADGEANSLNNLGKAYARLGERDKARDHFERALAIHRGAGNRYMMAGTLRNLGALDREAGDYAKALPFLEEALRISRAIRDRRGEAEGLLELARVEWGRGNLPSARKCADDALAALESIRLAVTSPRLRASLFASARDVQELDIAVLMRLHREYPGQGFDAAALLAAERGRARSLLEMLGESTAGIRSGIDEALLERERELERRIAGKAEQQMRLLGGRHTEAERTETERELDSLTAELEQVQSRIRETSPQYAALTQPVPLDLAGIQAKVLDQDTVLLEYALGTEKSFLWAVSTASMEMFELPPRAEIEAAAKRVYELVSARNQHPAGETPAARAARLRRADDDYPAAARQASRMLLGPAASRIADKRLLIVAEGVLHYLPFAALPEPDSAASAAPVPLIVNHEIVTAPSASVVAVLRRETAGRKPAEKAVAILADPVFSVGDSRLTGQRKEVAAASERNREAVRSGPDARPQEFVRLRFSRMEAEEIARLAAPAQVLKALDFDASRETVLRPDFGQYRIVHFATHSLLDNQHPELSGVVLSLVDRSGRPRNGFLRLYDIYNLRLGADLVVLSACRTALGEEIQGEGLIGLTRGFLYAGAPRVAATLWEIDDRTTAEAMKRFYEGMLGRGERPAAALRAAQTAMWRSRGWDAPYYWGAFTLQGEWR